MIIILIFLLLSGKLLYEGCKSIYKQNGKQCGSWSAWFIMVIVKYVNYTCWVIFRVFSFLLSTEKPVLNGHSNLDRTKVLKTNGSLMKVKSIAECSLEVFCNTF